MSTVMSSIPRYDTIQQHITNEYVRSTIHENKHVLLLQMHSHIYEVIIWKQNHKFYSKWWWSNQVSERIKKKSLFQYQKLKFEGNKYKVGY